MPRAVDWAHDPEGQFERKCPNCLVVFRTSNDRLVYCSTQCGVEYRNKRYYRAHREAIKNRMRLYQARKRKQLRKVIKRHAT
ncbi:MAG: hypothetical protein OHK0046_47900 [Anaerolineae bacterium]